MHADAEQRRAQQAVTLSPRAVVVRLHPSALASDRGCSSTGRAPRLQRGRCRFDSDRLHLRLRSVNGKHAPFVRPRCGFDSCRRLLPTPVAQRRERCSATAEAAGSTPAGRTTSADVAQTEEHRGATPGRPVRSGSSASKACGVTAASRAPTSPVRVRILVGLLHSSRSSRAGAARLSGESGARRRRCGSTPLPDRNS